MKNCLYLNTQMGNKITFEIVYFAPTLAFFFWFFLVLLILYIFLVLLIKSPHSVHIN